MSLGRNDLCYCGSGKKYKKCCLFTQAGQVETEEEILDRAVPPSVIQNVMDEVDRWSSDEFDRLAHKYTASHPVLLAFVAELLLPLPDAARNQSLLTVITLIRIFEKHYGRDHDAIAESDVTRAVDRNGRLMTNTFNRRSQRAGDVVQPFLLQFIGDVLFDLEPEEMPNDRDGFNMVMLLKTTLDLLDRAYARKRVSRDPVLAAR